MLELRGELDLLSAPELQMALDGADVNAHRMLVLDIRELQFIDSTGLRVILSARSHAEEHGRGFAVTHTTAQAQRVFDVAGVSKLLRIIDSPDELLV